MTHKANVFEADGGVAVGLPVATEAPQYVEVTAPATLAQGYSFTASVNGRLFNVEVPAGGVKEDQVFTVAYPQTFIDDGANGAAAVRGQSNTAGYAPPKGEWKDRLCDCCTLGCCHTSMLCALCCSPPFLGQIMTRLNLTWTGSPGTAEQTRKTFKHILIAFIMLQVIMAILQYIQTSISTAYLTANSDVYAGMDISQIEAQLVMLRNTGELGPIYNAAYYFNYAMSVALSIWLLVTMVRARMYIRRKYDIPTKCCGDNGVEDCCLSLWCPCCTLAQMARHTADYKNEPAACCTKTGLENAANNV